MKDIVKYIKEILKIILIGGLIVAILSLPQFDWDIFKMITWIVTKMWQGIQAVASYLISLPKFRDIFS